HSPLTKLKTQPAMRIFLQCLLICMLSMVAISQSGCKSKQKLIEEQQAQAEAANKARIDKAKTALTALMNDDSMSWQEKERRLDAIKSQNIDDPEVNKMIAIIEEQIAQEKARAATAAAEQQQQEEAQIELQEQTQSAEAELKSIFEDVASSPNLARANININKALSLFASSSAPVLIVINEGPDGKDYDRPTTILKYLNYLKDQKKNPNRVSQIKTDASGKIIELEVTKK
ncbi:MAG: hypothetical protein AAGI38_21875, partial [Bacteroidota bacterium]